jgi:hypothetical protein
MSAPNEPAESTEPEKWSMESTTTLFGRIGAVICWYFDGEIETPQHDYRLAARLVKRLPRVLQGDFDVLDDRHLLALWDALGSWPQHDKAIARLYQAFEAEQDKRGRPWLKGQHFQR